MTGGLNVTTGDVLLAVTSGNVGIGTTSPGSLLHLSSATAEIRLNDTDNPNWWQVGAVGDDFKIYLNDSSADGITIDQDGNVGIGTTSPNSKLTVIGGANITGGLNVTTGDVLLGITSGNVGIGLTNPGQKLHISGSVNVSATLNAPVINTTLSTQNLTLTSAGGSVIIRLG